MEKGERGKGGGEKGGGGRGEKTREKFKTHQTLHLLRIPQHIRHRPNVIFHNPHSLIHQLPILQNLRPLHCPLFPASSPFQLSPLSPSPACSLNNCTNTLK